MFLIQACNILSYLFLSHIKLIPIRPLQYHQHRDVCHKIKCLVLFQYMMKSDENGKKHIDTLKKSHSKREQLKNMAFVYALWDRLNFLFGVFLETETNIIHMLGHKTELEPNRKRRLMTEQWNGYRLFEMRPFKWSITEAQIRAQTTCTFVCLSLLFIHCSAVRFVSPTAFNSRFLFLFQFR